MTSPIINRLGGVFVHVSDMQRSIQWYSDILGLPPSSTTHEGNIYNVPVQGTHLLLDANTTLTQPDGKHPQFMFDTPDINASYHFLKEKGVEFISDIMDGGSVSFFAFKDPDGNILMACQNKTQTP